jgi:hypothetical protein
LNSKEEWVANGIHGVQQLLSREIPQIVGVCSSTARWRASAKVPFSVVLVQINNKKNFGPGRKFPPGRRR